MRTRWAHNGFGALPFEAFVAARWTASAQISLTPRFFCLACVVRVGRKNNNYILYSGGLPIVPVEQSLLPG